MTTREQFERTGAERGVSVRFWGDCGNEATERVEGILGIKLPLSVRSFAQNVGNVLIGPFDLIVCGDNAGELSCATESLSLRERHLLDSHPQASKLIKILDDAESSFFCNTGDPSIVCYETRRIVSGEHLHEFESFEKFVDWLFNEAQDCAD